MMSIHVRFFAEDISNQRLYVLSKDDVIISAFALCETNSGEKAVRWENPNGRVLYLDHFAVSPNYSGKGIGSFMLEKARELARAKGAEYLRLFVALQNGAALDYGCNRDFQFDAKCPDGGRVCIHGEVVRNG